MEKYALQLASVASMIDQFIIPNIQTLQLLGYKVDVVADFTNPGTITHERAEKLKQRLGDMGVRFFDIPIPRTLNPYAIYTAYKQVKNILHKEKYSLIHCHSPIGGVVARQAAKRMQKKGLKVIYTAHGFHFYKGAPLRNWMIFYPIEKYFSRYTDVLITINKEDFKIATTRFKAKRTAYIPGIGIDTQKYTFSQNSRDRIRAELKLNDNDILILSVGELNENKNHMSVIRALRNTEMVYAIVGKGNLGDALIEMAQKCNVDLRLMGYRDDVVDFYSAADIYVLPSIREGLNVSIMEAMSASMPVLCSKIRGNVDLIKDDRLLFMPLETNDIREKVFNILKMDYKKVGVANSEIIKQFDKETIIHSLKGIYLNL